MLAGSLSAWAHIYAAEHGSVFCMMLLHSLRVPSSSSSHLSAAIATSVKTDDETDMPCTRPLILQMLLLKGQPRRQREHRKGSFD